MELPTNSKYSVSLSTTPNTEIKIEPVHLAEALIARDCFEQHNKNSITSAKYKKFSYL